MRKLLANKTVRANGSGEAIGLELCYQIIKVGCKKLIIVDRYASYITELVRGVDNYFPREVIVPIVVDRGNENILEETFDKSKPNALFHWCMKKYVPYYGLDVENVGLVSYVQTFQLARMPAKDNCEYFTMISSLAGASGESFIGESLR